VSLPGWDAGLLAPSAWLTVTEYVGSDRVDVMLDIYDIIGPTVVLDKFREMLCDITKPQTVLLNDIKLKHAVMSMHGCQTVSKDMSIMDQITIIATGIEKPEEF